MNDETTNKIFQKIDIITEDIASIKTDIAVIKAQEKPSANCREHIMAMEELCRIKHEEMQDDMNNFAQKFDRKVNDKIGWALFWLIISALFGLIIGSYSYTWKTGERIYEHTTSSQHMEVKK